MGWSTPKVKLRHNNEFSRFYILPSLKKVSSSKFHTHLVKEIDEGTRLASLVLALKLLLTSHDWPKGLSPEAPSSYEVVSLSDQEFGWVAPHTTNLPVVTRDLVR